MSNNFLKQIFKSARTVRNRILFFHYRFAERFAQFVAQKQRVVTKSVRASVIIDNFAIRSSASADVTAIGIAQYNYALKVSRSIDFFPVAF